MLLIYTVPRLIIFFTFIPLLTPSPLTSLFISHIFLFNFHHLNLSPPFSNLILSQVLPFSFNMSPQPWVRQSINVRASGGVAHNINVVGLYRSMGLRGPICLHSLTCPRALQDLNNPEGLMGPMGQMSPLSHRGPSSTHGLSNPKGP